MAVINAFRMDGLGNNFIIIDRRKKSIQISKEKILELNSRVSFHRNIAFDQLIFIEEEIDKAFPITIFNSDGNEVSACGNGSRCVAYLLGKDLNTKNLNIKIISKNNNEHIGGTSINVGNPHVVFFIDNIEDYDLKKIGPEIENHNYFPEKCNVTLAKVINRNLIKVKVWERGAGLTKACGTAACATVAAANINGLADKQDDVEFALGKLTISIDKDNSIHMKGPVSDIKNIEIKI